MKHEKDVELDLGDLSFVNTIPQDEEIYSGTMDNIETDGQNKPTGGEGIKPNVSSFGPVSQLFGGKSLGWLLEVEDGDEDDIEKPLMYVSLHH